MNMGTGVSPASSNLCSVELTLVKGEDNPTTTSDVPDLSQREDRTIRQENMQVHQVDDLSVRNHVKTLAHNRPTPCPQPFGHRDRAPLPFATQIESLNTYDPRASTAAVLSQVAHNLAIP